MIENRQDQANVEKAKRRVENARLTLERENSPDALIAFLTDDCCGGRPEICNPPGKC